VSGVVFDDANRNGTQESGERGIAGVAVSNQDAVVTTDASGRSGSPAQAPASCSSPRPTAIAPSVRSGVPPTPHDRSPSRSRGSRGAELTFIHASDTHISPASLRAHAAPQGARRFVAPGLLIITGDLVRDALRVPEAEAPATTSCS
jgi:hypothetical protein